VEGKPVYTALYTVARTCGVDRGARASVGLPSICTEKPPINWRSSVAGGHQSLWKTQEHFGQCAWRAIWAVMPKAPPPPSPEARKAAKRTPFPGSTLARGVKGHRTSGDSFCPMLPIRRIIDTMLPVSHGRIYSVDRPGLYQVGFRFLDTSTNGSACGQSQAPSDRFHLWFQAGVTLASIRAAANAVNLPFGAPSNLPETGTAPATNYQLESTAKALVGIPPLAPFILTRVFSAPEVPTTKGASPWLGRSLPANPS
jgi:hypothetical protein